MKSRRWPSCVNARKYCRRTACRLKEMGGAPFSVVTTHASHSTVQMTMRYAHLMPVINILANDVVQAIYSADATLDEGQIDTDTGSSISFARARKLL